MGGKSYRRTRNSVQLPGSAATGCEGGPGENQMADSKKSAAPIFDINLRTGVLVLVLTVGFATAIIATQPAQAQTFSVIHKFRGEGDGSNPEISVTLDRAGNLYGGTLLGGNHGQDCNSTCGMIFKMTRAGSGWAYFPLYLFTGQDGGADSRLTFGPNGSLYGVGGFGGTYAYNLRPPATRCSSFLCEWNDTVDWTFCCEVESPGGLTFDQAGNMYGASEDGGWLGHCSGGNGCGYIFQLVPADGGWMENVIYEFHGTDGAHPAGELILDQEGNLYGTTAGVATGDGNGNVFELTPSGSGYWNETVLYSFQGGSDGKFPMAGVIFDPEGNLYGASASGGANDRGTIFELTPSNGGWNFNLLYSPSGSGPVGFGVTSSLIMDATGNLYGSLITGGAYGFGSVFKLTPSNGGWSYTSLHDFTGDLDGATPYGSPVMDSSGNLYGTTFAGGTSGTNCTVQIEYQCGVVFEITP